MAIYTITKEVSDDGENYYDTTIYRSPKIAFDKYISHISAIIWDFNTYLEDIVSDIKLYGKDKAHGMITIDNTTFSFSDTDEDYANLMLKKNEYNSDQKQYLCSEFNLKFTKENVKECAERVKLLRDKEKELEEKKGRHSEYIKHWSDEYFKYWTDEKIETLVNDIFEYGSPNIDKSEDETVET